MPFGRAVRRLSACLAVLSLAGWLELPSEHVHVAAEHGHRREYVHRHLASHLSIDDHAGVVVGDNPGGSGDPGDNHRDGRHDNDGGHGDLGRGGRDHDDAGIDHEGEATYLNGSAGAVTRIERPGPHFVALTPSDEAAATRCAADWLRPAQVVHAHSPPPRDPYSLRGPPASAV